MGTPREAHGEGGDAGSLRREGPAQVDREAVEPGLGGIGVPRAARGPFDVNMAVSFNAPLELMNEDWIEARVRDLAQCLP